MAITASLEYVKLADPTTFQINDTTPYAGGDSKSNFSARTLTILDSTNSPLAGYTNPINFPYGGGDSIVITGLTGDLALNITLTLTPITPVGGSIYTATAAVATNRFLEVGLYNINVQRLTLLTPSSLADQQYRSNSIDILIEMSNSQIAMLYGNTTLYTGTGQYYAYTGVTSHVYHF